MLVSFNDLSKIRETNPQSKIVFTGGCFDLLHDGHIAALKWRKMLGDILVVGVSSDERVRQKKGAFRPIQSEKTRVAVLDAIRYVDFTFVFPMPGDLSPTMAALHGIRPDIFVDGADHRGQWDNSAIAVMEQLGIKIMYDVQPRINSTTDIINRSLLTTEKNLSK